MSESQLRLLRDRAGQYRKQMQAESETISKKRKMATDARQAAAKSKNDSTIRSKLRQADTADSAVSTAEKKRAGIEKKLNATEGQIETLVTKNEKARAQALKTLERTTTEAASRFRVGEPGMPEEWSRPGVEADVFLSHASEDKDEIARPLQEALVARGVTVWFDEIQIKVGQSIRQEIERGIVGCRFGVVIISPAFFAKQWTQAELDGLFSKKMASGSNTILPIWHHVSKQDVLDRSPLLAGINALNSAVQTGEEMADSLAAVIRPEG